MHNRPQVTIHQLDEALKSRTGGLRIHALCGKARQGDLIAIDLEGFEPREAGTCRECLALMEIDK